jgi:hypothetical protein
MKEFYTRELHNNAKKFPLHTPDGKKTKKYLMISGRDSDYFRGAESELKRRINEDDYKDADREALFIACLVSGGNFTKTFSYDAAVELLTEAPYLRDDVNLFGCTHSNFLAKKPKA